VSRGLFREITSVPDIREQCWKVHPAEKELVAMSAQLHRSIGTVLALLAIGFSASLVI